MRFKLFILLGLLVISVLLGYQFSLDKIAVASETKPTPPHKSATPVSDTLHFSARNQSDAYASSDGIQTEILSVLQKLPKQHYANLKNITLDYDANAHRGLGGKHLIILRAANISSEEMMAVMIHEIGHTTDLGALETIQPMGPSEFSDHGEPIDLSDLSVQFYRISWQNTVQMKKEAGNLDFVSGYAMTDPFEDFAETYAYYVLHNEEFKALASTSDALYAKYVFMKNTVFNGETFGSGIYDTAHLNKRPWDVTVLDYDYARFLQS